MMDKGTLVNPAPQEKIYKEQQVWVGTFLGGPLAAGYYIASNFKQFGDAKNSKLTWLIAISFTFFILTSSLYAPYFERVPDFLFPLIYTAAAFLFVRIYQSRKMADHLSNGGDVQGWWRTIIVSLIMAILTLVLLFSITYVAMENYEVKYYGNQRHELMFVRDQISEDEVDLIAEALKETGMFAEDLKSYAHVEKTENVYEIFVTFEEGFVIDEETKEYYRELRTKLQKRLIK